MVWRGFPCFVVFRRLNGQGRQAEQSPFVCPFEELAE
jgi:hypothetical protein